ncbi:MAG: hypothetical protein JXR96_19420, partial [Deltaproteobacteria bacterium]|nr:hypothetical protein [Deltaproteobacteria bacterium]
MRRVISVFFLAALCLASWACSSSSSSGNDAGACTKTCSSHDECNRGQYCDDEGCCRDGCAYDDDCPSGHCNQATHECEGGGEDGGTDGGQDAGGGDSGG